MNQDVAGIALSSDAVKKPAPNRSLGAFLEYLRCNCPVNGKQLSIRSVSRMAGMSNTTYEHVKRAIA